MRRRWTAGAAIGVCLAACGADGGDGFIVPAYEELMQRPTVASCTEDDLDGDGRIDERTRLVEADGGRTWDYEARDGAGELVASSQYHFDAAGRLLDSSESWVGSPTSRCFWVYDSFGREVRSECDTDGDGVFDETQRVTAWTDAGKIAAAERVERGRPVAVTMSYDERGRLVANESRWSDDGALRYTLDVAYDDVARTRTSISWSMSASRKQTVTYDAGGRRLRLESIRLDDPEAAGFVVELFWAGDTLEKTVTTYDSGRKATTRYLECEG